MKPLILGKNCFNTFLQRILWRLIITYCFSSKLNPDWNNWRKPFLGLNWTQNVKLNSDLQNNTFIGFLDPKNIGKEVAFIILACFVILHYISSSHFEKTAKKHVFTRGILLYFFLVISMTPRRQNQQKSFDLEFFPRLGYFGLRCLQYWRET